MEITDLYAPSEVILSPNTLKYLKHTDLTLYNSENNLRYCSEHNFCKPYGDNGFGSNVSLTGNSIGLPYIAEVDENITFFILGNFLIEFSTSNFLFGFFRVRPPSSFPLGSGDFVLPLLRQRSSFHPGFS